MAKKNTTITFGMSFISVPLENATQSDYAEWKQRKEEKSDFKQWIHLSYSSKKQIITVSCIRKRQEVLHQFLENSNFP